MSFWFKSAATQVLCQKCYLCVLVLGCTEANKYALTTITGKPGEGKVALCFSIWKAFDKKKFSHQKVMERLVKKYEQKYRKAREEMDKWDALQLRLLKQFRNAAAIIERLKVLGDKENYGVLKVFSHIAKELPAKQVESLEFIFVSMRSTLDEFNKVVTSLKKMWQDGCHLLKGETLQPTLQQIQMRVGLRPSLSDCLDGLKAIYEMHLSEYLLKVSIISALSYDSRAGDVAALQAVLADQPNIPTNEVQFIFNIIFAEEIS